MPKQLPSLAKLIHTRLLVSMVLLSLCSALFLGAFFYFLSVNEFEKKSIFLTATLAKYTDNYVQRASEMLHHIGSQLETEQKYDKEATEPLLQRIFQTTQIFSRILLVSPDNMVVVSTPSGKANVDFALQLSSPDKNTSLKLLGRPRPINEGKEMVVYLGHILDNGGMIVGALRLDALQKHIIAMQPGAGETIILTDSWGTIIAHPDESKILQQDNIGFLPFYHSHERTAWITMDRNRFFASSMRVPSTNWHIISALPQYSVFKSTIKPIAVFLLLLLLLYSIFSLFVFSLIQRRIALPFLRFTQAMERFAKGKLDDTTLQRPHFDELESMQRTFFSMAEQIHIREFELKNARTYIKGIIDSMPSAVIALDTFGSIAHMNTAAERRFSIKEQDARGRQLTTLYPQLSIYHTEFAKAQTHQIVVALERQTPVIDDVQRYEDIQIYPLRINQEEGLVIRIDDVTHRVKMEEVMVQTEKMMSVGGLAAGMAHEINNPLGAILQSAQNIERRLSPSLPANVTAAEEAGCTLENIESYLKKRQIDLFLLGIREAGTRASEIVSNMLDFSRKSETRRSTIDLHTTLDKTIELASNDYDLKKQYDFRAIKIIREYDLRIGGVICSSNEIEQVMLNLLRNAAQALHNREDQSVEPYILVRTKEAGTYVVIEVEDNGPGMSEETRKRVFEPFFTTKEVGIGTGLGLSVSYFIITENHKGAFDVDSTLGKGTKFTIKLPYSTPL